MNYKLIPTKFLLGQLDLLSDKAKKILKEKILILKENPARFKQISGFPYNLFRIRFQDLGKSKRLIYAIEGGKIKLLYIINRDKNYSDLKKYILKFKKNKKL